MANPEPGKLIAAGTTVAPKMKTSLKALSKNLLMDIKDLPDVEISGISLNSSKTKPGDLFIAISGLKQMVMISFLKLLTMALKQLSQMEEILMA